MSELKPCPFCGGLASQPASTSPSDERCGYNFVAYVECSACGVSTRTESNHDKGGWCNESIESAKARAVKKWNSRTQPEATKPAQDLSAAIRLRLVCKLLGLEGAVPEDDADLWGCAFSVLGMIRSKLEEQKPIGFVVQHDANGGNFFTGVTSFEGMRKTYGVAAKLVFGVPVNNLSNAILALPCKAEGSTLPLQQHYASGFRAALDAAAALASPADALLAVSAQPEANADAKDAGRWRFRQKLLLNGGCVLFSQRGVQFRDVHGVILCQGPTEEEAIDAAIQAQKDGHG